MPLPWKKSKSGRISKLVSDLQQSPKHGGSLVLETGFPTSLIHLFFKNRDRLKKSSSKRNKAQTQTAPTHSLPTPRQLVSSSSLPPPIPQKHDPPSVTEDLPASKIEESVVVRDGGLTSDDGNGGDARNGGGCCVLMVVAVKVFVVAVLALSTKKLAVGITISAFALLFLEFAVPRVLTLLNLCPDAQVRLDSLIRKLIGKNLESSSSSPPRQERTTTTTNNVSFEIIETFQEPRDCIEEETRVPEPPAEKQEEREVLTIRDVAFTKEKSKSAKLKSKIVKKIVPKKLRSYKKKKKLKKMKEKEGVETEIFEEGEGESTTEASSLYSEDVTESEVSERYEIGSNPPLLESCEEEEDEGSGSKGDLRKAMVMIVIALAGLVGGKVVAIVLTVSSCLFLRLVCSAPNLKLVSDKSV